MSELFQQIRVLLTPRDKIRMAGLLAMMFVGAVAELIGVSILMPVVALFTKPELLDRNKYVAAAKDVLAAGDPERFAVMLCGATIAFFVVKNLYGFWLVHLQTGFVNRKVAALQERLFANYLYAPYRYHLDHDSSELVYRRTRLEAMAVQVLMPLMLLITESMVAVVIVAMLMFFAPVTTLVTASATAALLALMYLALRNIGYRCGRAQSVAEERALKSFLAALGGIKDVKLFGAEPAFLRRFGVNVGESSRSLGKLYVLGQIPRLGIETIVIVLAMGILIAFTLNRITSGAIIMTIAMFVAAAYRLLPSFTRIHYNLMIIRQQHYSFAQVFHDLTALPRESVSTSAAPIELKSELTVERLSFRYREDAPWIFKDFSLRIKAFSSVAFTGKTGCGKTTLADLVMGFLDPAEGNIRVDGRDIRENLASWRARIGYVPQSIYMLNDSIRRNVAFGIEDEAIDDAGVWRALELAQIADFVKGIPERLDTEIGERGVRLSGGQRQRIGIARALYRNPDMLILDEATSALDVETEQAFVEAIGALQGKLTMIVIAHRLSTVEKCDVILKIGEA